jgi:hypothetical protein
MGQLRRPIHTPVMAIHQTTLMLEAVLAVGLVASAFMILRFVGSSSRGYGTGDKAFRARRWPALAGRRRIK